VCSSVLMAASCRISASSWCNDAFRNTSQLNNSQEQSEAHRVQFRSDGRELPHLCLQLVLQIVHPLLGGLPVSVRVLQVPLLHLERLLQVPKVGSVELIVTVGWPLLGGLPVSVRVLQVPLLHLKRLLQVTKRGSVELIVTVDWPLPGGLPVPVRVLQIPLLQLQRLPRDRRERI